MDKDYAPDVFVSFDRHGPYCVGSHHHTPPQLPRFRMVDARRLEAAQADAAAGWAGYKKADAETQQLRAEIARLRTLLLRVNDERGVLHITVLEAVETYCAALQLKAEA